MLSVAVRYKNTYNTGGLIACPASVYHAACCNV
jgi:hypothetical protein